VSIEELVQQAKNLLDRANDDGEHDGCSALDRDSGERGRSQEPLEAQARAHRIGYWLLAGQCLNHHAAQRGVGAQSEQAEHLVELGF
jgi:hypothetical protein